MGIIFSRFKKKKTTLEILEKLDKDITSIEQYRMNTEQRQRRIVGQLIVYSVGAYVLAAAMFYFYWFPNTMREQLICVAPLLCFPFLVLLLKRVLTFYYSRKITQNDQKLCDLRAEKKKILEDVMDKETYKVARTILEKFAPDQLRSKGMEQTPNKPNSTSFQTPSAKQVVQTPTTLRPGLPTGFAATELRRRTLPSTVGRPGAPSSLSAESLSSGSPALSSVKQVQQGTGTPMPMHRPSFNGQGFAADYRPTGPPLPRPVLPRERSYLDRVVEYLVGDGPSNRFALICKSCESHNGMALKEEFEYLPFRCCYCHYWNPARKQRPQAPRLTPVSSNKPQPMVQGGVGIPRSSTENDETSDSEKYSGSDSSEEDSGPELQPLDNSPAKTEDNIGDGQTSEMASESIKDSLLDQEAEEFLRSLEKRNKQESNPDQEELLK